MWWEVIKNVPDSIRVKVCQSASQGGVDVGTWTSNVGCVRVYLCVPLKPPAKLHEDIMDWNLKSKRMGGWVCVCVYVCVCVRRIGYHMAPLNPPRNIPCSKATLPGKIDKHGPCIISIDWWFTLIYIDLHWFTYLKKLSFVYLFPSLVKSVYQLPRCTHHFPQKKSPGNLT